MQQFAQFFNDDESGIVAVLLLLIEQESHGTQ
jgi:hypothetical protein